MNRRANVSISNVDTASDKKRVIMTHFLDFSGKDSLRVKTSPVNVDMLTVHKGDGAQQHDTSEPVRPGL